MVYASVSSSQSTSESVRKKSWATMSKVEVAKAAESPAAWKNPEQDPSLQNSAEDL